MVANLTGQPVHVHAPDGSLHLVLPGAEFPPGATPRIRTRSLEVAYANKAIETAPPPAGRIDPRTLPSPVTVSGRTATSASQPYLNQPLAPEVDIDDLDDETRQARYQEELLKLQAKYYEKPQYPAADESLAAPSPYDSLLWGPAEAEHKRQREAARDSRGA
jgi:hypothetical protein